MTPSENIYQSDHDMVDGLDAVEESEVEFMIEDEFDIDDGQPTVYDEYQDLYGGDDYDFGQYDYIEGE
jgi:hypothetical protein